MIFNKTVLQSGMRVVTIPMKDNPSVAVLIMVEAGSKYETKEINGISHFLEHMVFKGTPKRPKSSDISRELDGIGAQYNAFTSHEVTGYWVKADARHLDTALDVVADMYLNPLLDASEMEKEKGVIVEEIRMYKDLPQQRVQEVMSKLLYNDQPAGWSIAGTEENVRSYTRDQVVKYRKENYVASATTLIVAGQIDEKSVLEKVKKIYETLPNTAKQSKLAVKESQNEPAIAVEFKETDQTHLVIACRTFPIADKRDAAMHVLSTILGKGMSSRLFTKMRDELGICYYVRTNHEASTDHGFLSISAGVDNSRVDIAVKEILAQCARLKTELVGEAELKKAKDYIAGTTMLELETSESRAEYAGSEEVFKHKIEKPEDAIRKVSAVTAADVQKLAKEVFVNEGLNLAIVGRSKAEPLKSIFKFA